MSLGKKIFHQAAAGEADAPQGLVLHLDANDEDSIESGGANTGAGSGTWFDIAGHDLNIPRIDKGSNLKFHINASDTTSYSGSGADWNDISGNNINGTITDPEFVSDLAGSLKFDYASNGDGDKVVFAHDPVFNKSTNVSFEVWVKRDTTSEMNILHKGSSISDSHFLTWNSNGYYFYSFTTTGGVYSTTTGYNTGVFEHVVCTIDGSGNKKMYVNGEISQNSTNGSVGTTNLSNTDNLVIGGFYGPATHRGFDGQISVVRIYDVTLTASEVAQNYRAGHNFSYSSIYSTNALIDYRPSNYSGSGTSITNLGTLSNDAVITGGVESTYDKELGDFFTIDGSSNTGDGIETTSNVTGINLSTDGFSWEFWFKITSDSFSFIASFNYSTTDWNLSYRANTDTIMFFGGTTLNTPTLDLNRWYHIVASADSNGKNLYLNGVLVDSNTSAAPNATLNSKIFFGTYHSHSSSDHIHTGPLGDMRFHEGVLTPAQVAQNYLATKNDYPNGFNATINGATFATNGGSPNEKYFDFDGSNDFMSIPHNTIFDFATPTTMTLWVNRDSTNRDFIIDKTQSNGWQFEYNGSSYVFQLEVSGGLLDVREGVSGTGSWEHIVVTLDSSLEGKLYLNGVFKDSDSTSGTVSTNTNGITIGKYSLAGGYEFDGKIAMVKFYNATLSASEVLAEFNATKATFGL